MIKIIQEHDGKVVRLVLNRPEALNALNQSMLGHLAIELEAISKSSMACVVVFQGAGDKAFVAGADISEMKTMTAFEAEKFSKLGQSVFSLIDRLPQVTIAMVQGFALGGGCELAMACDLIYASEKSKFGNHQWLRSCLGAPGQTRYQYTRRPYQDARFPGLSLWTCHFRRGRVQACRILP